MKEFKPCGSCVHFFVCNNVYAEVDKDMVIKNIDGEPCYYYDSKVVARATYDRLLKSYKKLLEDNENLRGEIEDLELKMSYMVNPNSIGNVHEMGCW